MTKRPEECQTMEDVRTAIDCLDEKLVQLLAERQRYVERAGLIKERRDTVRDPARIEDVVAKVIVAARKAELDPAIAEPVWRTMIEHFIERELRVYDARRLG